MKTLHTDCPVTKTAQLLSDTWTMLILHTLLAGPQRFCEIERALEGISTRTLTLKLKKLEEEGVVEKGTDGSYAVTERGTGLQRVVKEMTKYGEEWL